MDNELLVIPEENILLGFELDNQDYVVISEIEEAFEGDEVYLAKRNIVEGKSIIRNIEDDEEYARVLAKYQELINELEGDEDEQ